MIQAIIISVSTAHARRKMQKKQLDKLGLKGQIWDAVTPADLTKDILLKHKYSWARPLRDGEVACALSHKKVWEHIANSDTPCLVLEDDVLLSKDIKEVLASLAHRADLEFVSLEYYDQLKLLGKQVALDDTNYNICRLYRDRGGAAAYIMWPSAAKKILKAHKNTMPLADAAIDLTLPLNAFQLEPACAVQSNVMARYHSEFVGLDVANQVAPSPRPEYPNKLIYLTNKYRRALCSVAIFRKQLSGLGKATNRHIKYTVTPELLQDSITSDTTNKNKGIN